MFGRGRGAQNGERRGGFGNSQGPRNLENQENLDRAPNEGRRGGFRGNRHANNKTETSEGDEVNPKFASGFPESRTFRGRGFGGGRRGYNRRGNFNRGGGGGGFPGGGGGGGQQVEGTEEGAKSEDHAPKTEGSASEIGHWENEGDAEGRGEGRPGNRGRPGFGRRGRGRGRGGGFGGPRRDFNRPPHDGPRGAKPADKKDGSGSHNWGTVMDDLE